LGYFYSLAVGGTLQLLPLLPLCPEFISMGENVSPSGDLLWAKPLGLAPCISLFRDVGFF